MICFGWILWHINHCRLFNAKSYLYIHIEYIWFVLVGSYGISTIVGYLMPNLIYTYIWFVLVGFYSISTIVGYLNPFYTLNMNCKHIFLIKFLNELSLFFLHTVKGFQVLLCNSNNLTSVICLQFKCQTILFDHIDRTRCRATTSVHRPVSDDNKGELCIPQSSKTGASPSDCLVSYPKHSLREFYSSVEMQSVYSTASADWNIEC